MSWIDGLRHRLHVWRHADTYAEEQARERSFHREMEALHGGPRKDAPARGGSGPERVRNDAPGDGHPGLSPGGSSILDRLTQDLRYALRGLARSPGFTAVAVLTLTLGVGANAAVFSLLDRLFNQPPAGVMDPGGLRRLYIEFSDRIVDGRPMVYPSWNYPAFSAIESAENGAYDAAAWSESEEETIQEGGRDLLVRTSYVTHDYFSVLGVSAARGRIFGPEVRRIDVPAPFAVISQAFWERGFGLDPAVVGRTIQLGDESFTVVGVAQEGFSGLDLSYTDLFLPLSMFPVQPQQGRPWYENTGNYLSAVARLSEGADDRQLEQRATAGYGRRVLPEPYRSRMNSTDAILAGSIIETRGPGRRTGGPDQQQALSISARAIGVSAVLLLIAYANVAGLLLVRATRRQHEIAVRVALGVSRSRLVSQLLTEGLLLSSVAGAAAVFLGMLGGRILRQLLLPQVQWAQPAAEPRMVLFTLSTAAVVGLVAALAPVLQLGGLNVVSRLKSSAKGGVSRTTFRSALLVAQVALSIVLLVGAGLFVRSLGNVEGLRLGFDTDELAYIRLPLSLSPIPGQSEALAEAASRLGDAPGVSGVALAMHVPMLGNTSTGIFLRGSGVRTDEGARFNFVSPEFFAVTGMRILEGRGFEEEESGVVVVDETMAKIYWPGESALGQCLVTGTPDNECRYVIGVVEDQRRSRVIEEPMLQYFRPLGASATPGAILLRVDPRRWSSVAAIVRQEVYSRFDQGSVTIGRMTDGLEAQFRVWRVGSQLFIAFGVIALLITVVGVYGVVAYAVGQRTQEMGVRIALGARLQDIMRLVLGDGLRVVSLGIVLGVAIAFMLGRLIESFLYGVTPRDSVATLAAVAVMIAAGVAASFVPAWRAGRVDPCEALRQE